MQKVLSLIAFVVVASGAAAQVPEELSGWSVQVESPQAVPEGTSAKVTVPLPGMIAGADLVIPDVVYSDQGVVVRSGEGKTPVELRGTNGFRFLAQGYALGSRGLELNGSAYLPEALGGAALKLPRGKVFLEPDGALIVEETNLTVTWKLGDLEASSPTVAFDRSGLRLGAGTVSIPDSDKVPFGAVTFRIDGSLVAADAAEGPPTLTVHGVVVTATAGFRVTEDQFTTNDGTEHTNRQLQFSGSVHLPAPFGEASSAFEQLTIEGSGRLRSEFGGAGDYQFEHQGLQVRLGRPRFDSTDGFQFDEVQFTFPEALGGGSLNIDSLAIRPSGAIDLYGFRTAAVPILGLPVSFDKIAFNDKGFVGEGGYIALGRTPGPLSSLGGISVPALRVGFDGTLEKAEFRLSDASGVSVTDQWELDNVKLGSGQKGPGKPVVLWLSGSVTCQNASGELATVTVQRLPLDLEANRFSFDTMRVAPLRLDRGSVQFNLLYLTVSDEGSLVFQGTARVADPLVSAQWPEAVAQVYRVVRFVLPGYGKESALLQGTYQAPAFTITNEGGWKKDGSPL